MAAEEKLGLRVFTKVNRVPREKFEKLMQVTTGNVCDAMDRFGSMEYQIKPVDPGMKCVGSAITVKARPCDNLIVYKALEIAQPGDIIFGDVDGVVVIPQESVDQVVRRALEIAAEEEKKVEDIKSGHLIPDWVGKILKERGYIID
jgi:regulator of RNase E activity RraA